MADVSEPSDNPGASRSRPAREIDDLGVLEVASTLQEYVRLVDARIPQRYYPGERRSDPWRYLAAAQVARFAEIGRSCALLLHAGQLPDAVVLSRVLYDHVVTFCWTHADPDDRADRLVAAANDEARKLRSDWGRYSADELPAIPKDAPKPATLPGLPDRAQQADAFWSVRDPRFHSNRRGAHGTNVLTFRGLYSVVFRTASQQVHAGARSAEQCLVEEVDARILVTPPREPDRLMVVMPALVTGLGLIAASHILGWPDRDEVTRINDALVLQPEEGSTTR